MTVRCDVTTPRSFSRGRFDPVADVTDLVRRFVPYIYFYVFAVTLVRYHQQCDVNYFEIRRPMGIRYRRVLRIS